MVEFEFQNSDQMIEVNIDATNNQQYKCELETEKIIDPISYQ